MRSNEEKKVQVHFPYQVLVARLGEIIAGRINPEIFMDRADLEAASLAELKRVARELSSAGLRVTMHGPYSGVNPGSADESVRIHTMEVYEKAFEAASILRPVNIVLHAGYNEGRFKGGAREWMAQSLKTWPRFAGLAADIGVTIAAENIFEKEPSTLKALVEAVASPSFRVCLDAGHLAVFSSVPFEEWFASLGPHIAEVHLHDNNSGADEHLPIGEGSIDFPLFFHLLGLYATDPVYTIEPHGEATTRRAIKAVKAYL